MKELDYYMNLNYTMEIKKDEAEGGYVISYPELRGCITCSQSRENVFKLAEDAKKAWLLACIEDGIEIPLPQDDGRYSNKFNMQFIKSHSHASNL